MRKNNLITTVGCILAALGILFTANGQVNVTEHHNHDSRDGLYVDPTFTPAGAAGLTRDLAFNGSITGDVYAQPLYIEGNPNGKAMVIVVTEANNVYALDATNGTIIWQANAGPSVPLSALPCGNLSTYGITGTPIVDLPSRSLFFDAMVMVSGSPEHLIFSMDVDTGIVHAGWPVNVGASARFGSTDFTPETQGQRGALAIVGTNVYVPFGGLDGDCDTYYGWVVGVPMNNPAIVMAWATSADHGGIWSPNGVSSDGTSPFFATGNTYNASVWGGGEAIIHPQPNLVLPSGTVNYWAPVNWASLDNSDLDIGSSGALLVNVPGATPSMLVAAFGKDGNAYLLNRSNLGGISAPVAKLNVAGGVITTAPATYQTSKGTYVVYAYGGYLCALRIGASSPPTLTSVWSASEGGGSGSAFVTSTDGTNNVIVWGIGSESDQRLHAFDGDTGTNIFTGGGANELMAGTRRRNTAIVARGRIYVANDNMVYAFSVPTGPAGPSPVANNDSYSFTENTTLTVAAPGVLANDTDSVGYTLTAALESNPAHGSLTLNPNGGFAYTPATNFSGSDSFTYYATDGTSNSSVATVTLAGLAAGVLFSDNFVRATNPGPLTPWVAESGTWTVTGGMMEDSAAQGYAAVYVTNSWSNYTVQASVRFSTTSAYGGGISARLNPGTGARYAAWIYPENSPANGPILRLVKFQSWTTWSYLGTAYTPIQQVTLSGVSTNWHTLQLSCQGNQLTVTYDGTQVLSAADAEASPYSSGAIDLDTFTGSTPFTFSVENVMVTGSGSLTPGPAGPIRLASMAMMSNGSFQFTFTNTPGVGFSVLCTTNLSAPFTKWTPLGSATEVSSGHFQFNDPQARSNLNRFYRVSSP